MLQNIAIDRGLPDFEEDEEIERRLQLRQPQPDEDGDDVENVVPFGRGNGVVAYFPISFFFKSNISISKMSFCFSSFSFSISS